MQSALDGYSRLLGPYSGDAGPLSGAITDVTIPFPHQVTAEEASGEDCDNPR
jgi:hypothetical protein